MKLVLGPVLPSDIPIMPSALKKFEVAKVSIIFAVGKDKGERKQRAKLNYKVSIATNVLWGPIISAIISPEARRERIRGAQTGKRRHASFSQSSLSAIRDERGHSESFRPRVRAHTLLADR